MHLLGDGDFDRLIKKGQLQAPSVLESGWEAFGKPTPKFQHVATRSGLATRMR